MSATDSIFYIVVLVMSIVIHEVAHGFAAEYFGDQTARYAGRLTLNPLKHLDLFGSIILPLFLIFTQAGFLFGWAKPVPYNPNNLSNRRWGTLAVASAGVLANFLIAIVFGLFIRLAPFLSITFPGSLYFILSMIVLMNLGLAVFNLVPIPPLDGSKILFSLLPDKLSRYGEAFEESTLASTVLLIGFIVLLSSYLAPVLGFLFQLLTGLTF